MSTGINVEQSKDDVLIEQSKDDVLMTTIALLARLESDDALLTSLESEETGVDGEQCIQGPRFSLTPIGEHRVHTTIRKMVRKYSSVPSERENRLQLRKVVYKLRLRRLSREVKALQQRRWAREAQREHEEHLQQLRRDRTMRREHEEHVRQQRRLDQEVGRDRIVRQQALRALVADEAHLMTVRLRGSLKTVFEHKRLATEYLVENRDGMGWKEYATDGETVSSSEDEVTDADREQETHEENAELADADREQETSEEDAEEDELTDASQEGLRKLIEAYEEGYNEELMRDDCEQKNDEKGAELTDADREKETHADDAKEELMDADREHETHEEDAEEELMDADREHETHVKYAEEELTEADREQAAHKELNERMDADWSEELFWLQQEQEHKLAEERKWLAEEAFAYGMRCAAKAFCNTDGLGRVMSIFRHQAAKR